ncbi:heme ABC exporter ATP-binding protein CcmA [Oceaniglobus indicus]|uniref:heme ABC exporter ATP-binding protein CcmA n=1 Tax=Oceaniglobus indicus TaxID=2047749 RepID=UPI000C19B526|nr:heme ABC exporter ATP-binding protein CcmA [Oceaniglobus indicus]
MTRLRVRDLACARGGVPVLSDVAFTLGQGRALILRGPNGSGKTTLLRTLAGLQPALRGTIDPGPEAVAYAGHADGLKGGLSVAANLTFWAGIFGTRDIAPALEAFDLTDLRERAAQNLSAGQKRRLGLARMVLTQRPVWIFDEPTVSLDTASVGLFARAVESHLAQGGAAIVATHIDLGLTADVLDIAQFRARAMDDPFATGVA